MTKLKSLLKTIRPLRSAHFMLMLFLGAFLSYNMNPLNTILGMISIFFAWQFNLNVNDIFDVEIDKISNKDRILSKEMISSKRYLILGLAYLVISIIIILIVDIISLIFISLFMFMGYIYSGPPFRLRKYPFQTIFIGFGSFLAFQAGFFTSSNFIPYREFVVSILILVALSLGTVVKDYKDYEGDKVGDITTIFTKYGLDKGMKITSICLFITFLIPLLLIYHLIDFIILIPIAISVVIMFNWKKNQKKVEITFIFYFIEIAYVLLRYVNVIVFI